MSEGAPRASPLVAKRSRDLALSAIKEMAIRSAGVPDAVSLAWGLPSFRTPEHIRLPVENMLEADPDIGKYALPDGLPELRALVAKEHFAYTRGEGLVRSFAQSERVNRYFCGHCGSPLPMVEDWDPLVGIPAALFDDDIGARVSSHIFVGSKAPWWEITDALPQHDEYPPGEDMNERAAALRSED